MNSPRTGARKFGSDFARSSDACATTAPTNSATTNSVMAQHLTNFVEGVKRLRRSLPTNTSGAVATIGFPDPSLQGFSPSWQGGNRVAVRRGG